MDEVLDWGDVRAAVDVLKGLTAVDTDVAVKWTWYYPIFGLNYLCYPSSMRHAAPMNFPVVSAIDPNLRIGISKPDGKAV